MTQEELMAVIEGQGLVPSNTDHTQLRQAILKMIQSAQKAVVISGVTFAPAVTASGQAVYWDTVNSRFDLALADGSAKQAAVGFSDIVNGAVYALGDAVLFTGLTPGHCYLSGTVAGAITASVPTTNVVSVGVAKSATELFIDIDAGFGITQSAANAQYAPIAYSQFGGNITSNISLTFSQSGKWFELSNGIVTLPSTSGTPCRFAFVGLGAGGQIKTPDGVIILPDASQIAANVSSPVISQSMVWEVFGDGAGGWYVVSVAGKPIVQNGTAANHAVSFGQSFGLGQSTQNVTASRALSTTYTNTTGKPIEVLLRMQMSATAIYDVYKNGAVVTQLGSPSLNNQASMSFIVLAGETYSVAISTGTGSIGSWWEVR
jgi:hypothetical protein